jgi:hypothetical protein
MLLNYAVADGIPDIVVHAPSDVEVDDSAENVYATPIADLGPLPPPPHVGSGILVMFKAPDDVLGESGGEAIASAARNASDSDDILTVSFEHADALSAEALDRLTRIGEQEGVSRIHVYVGRRG